VVLKFKYALKRTQINKYSSRFALFDLKPALLLGVKVEEMGMPRDEEF
jgi:hypothetical protein